MPCALVAFAGGCASPSTADQTAPAQAPVNSGLEALRNEGDTPASDEKPDLGRLTENFERGLDELDALMKPPPRRETKQAAAAESATKPVVQAATSEQKSADDAGAGGADVRAAGGPGPEDLLRSVSADAAGMLESMYGEDPYALAVRLVSLRAATGSAAPGLNALVDRLPVEQREVVLALDEVLTGASKGRAAFEDSLASRSAVLDEGEPIEIARAELCSRVEAFGRYTELGRDGFVAGRPIPMIVYTEAAHFDQVPVLDSAGGSGADETWEVRLGQEVLLYHESDGLLAWRRPEQVTVYRSKTRLHDYFLVDRIELPRTLTVGAYRLKVVLRDLHDRSVDEKIIPIRVVADQKLATGYGG